MVTNVNEPVWTSGEIVHSGGGADAAIRVPSDIDTIVVDLSNATGANVVDIEVALNDAEAQFGIAGRCHRYQNLEVNDLGATGELRLDPVGDQSFLTDGWLVGDLFFGRSHKIPDFNDPNRKSPIPVTEIDSWPIGGTVATVAVDVITFALDPDFSLAAGEAVIDQSRAAIVESSLTYAINAGLTASTTQAQVTLTGVAGKKVRVNVSTGTADTTYEMRGLHGSAYDKGPEFIDNIENRPFAGLPGAFGTFLAGPDLTAVWTRAFVDGCMRAELSVPGIDFDALGLAKLDRLFVRGWSPTGNGGMWSVNAVAAGAGALVTMYQDIRGVVGTDTPGRLQFFQHPNS